MTKRDKASGRLLCLWPKSHKAGECVTNSPCLWCDITLVTGRAWIRHCKCRLAYYASIVTHFSSFSGRKVIRVFRDKNQLVTQKAGWHHSSVELGKRQLPQQCDWDGAGSKHHSHGSLTVGHCAYETVSNITCAQVNFDLPSFENPNFKTLRHHIPSLGAISVW